VVLEVNVASKKEVLETLVEKDIRELGYELEYVENVCENKENILRIVLDKDGAITTEDCEKVSRTLEEKIDGLVNYSEGYVLEVSSPGLERKLKNPRLYKKYLGFKIKIKLYDKQNDKKEFMGILEEVNENGIILIAETEKGQGKEKQQTVEKVEIDFQNIASGNTVYDF